MTITHAQLDTPFNEIDKENEDNTETPRQFIAASEEEFGMEPCNPDTLSVESLNKHIEFLDYLWTK